MEMESELRMRITKPYRAAMKEDWNSVKEFYKERKEHYQMIILPMTISGDTVLHIAAHSGNTKFVKSLLDDNFDLPNINPSLDWRRFYASDIFPIQNEYGNTVLHEAASGGHIKMVKVLLRYEGGAGLLEVKNERGETPLFRAAAFGRTEVVRILASKVEDMEAHRRRADSTTILHIAVLGRYFETAVELLQHDNLADSVDENGMTCFQLLANMPSAFRSRCSMGILTKLLYYCLPEKYEETVYVPQSASNKEEDLEIGRKRHQRVKANHTIVLPAIGELREKKKGHSKVVELVEILAKKDLSWMGGNYGGDPDDKIHIPVEEKDDGDVEKYDEADHFSGIHTASKTSFLSDSPLIAAARNGIVEIAKAILDVYPQAIEHVNHKSENIFHVAVAYRRVNILDLLQSSHTPILRLARKITSDGDSILHKAAALAEYSLRERPGEALLMQSDIQWFKRVQKMVPSYFINHRNNDNFTAQVLFSIKHKHLVKRGQEWLMRTTRACTLVAVLIATVAFTCAYTIPGGSDSETGQPLLLKKTPFIVYTTSDTLSLCFALTSVVVFLSIMTSKMQEQDFRRSLPMKLVLGLTTLFFAVSSMMVAFAATLVLMIRQRLHWAAIPIYTIVCLPVAIFLVLQLPLYLNIAWFTVHDIVYSFIASFPGCRCLNQRSCTRGSSSVRS
ncbi:protein ACCELERATED CELL DEATH 6-like isoform X2 [Humulus lupulus]|uniref:protein ACCELERATED CELL DEATH 6-like isoform X2 n=1 Tax=Humulus lupulus TaxID=3486 RepID=UPI002B404763|nr:protein ACCELERATED CELL DEATH 6-like isoform X2 [Humulus lupulus]